MIGTTRGLTRSGLSGAHQTPTIYGDESSIVIVIWYSCFGQKIKNKLCKCQQRFEYSTKARANHLHICVSQLMYVKYNVCSIIPKYT